MSAQTDIQPYDRSTVPDVITRYLDLQVDPKRRAGVADLFDPTGRVVDENVEYVGVKAIRGWLARAASAYTYTTTLTGQIDEGDGRWTVTARLEGNFPGGVADLRYRFRVVDGAIVDLVIAP